MKYEIIHPSSYALARLALSAGETVIAEAGAMVSMSPDISIETKARGGIMKSLKRSILGGESFFVNTFRAQMGGELTLAPCLPGDVSVVELTGGTIYVQSGSFLASVGDIEIDTQWGGAKTFFSGKGFFMLRCTGTGTLFISSFGAIEEKVLAADEEYIVDTGHIVCFDESMKWEINASGGLKTTLFGGEGLVCRYHGPGRLKYQTRNFSTLVTTIAARMPQQHHH